MRQYVNPVPPELEADLFAIEQEVSQLLNVGGYKKAAQLLREEYELLRETEEKQPANTRLHKGSPLYNWGVTILLQRDPEKIEEGFKKILLAFVEDLFDFDTEEQALRAPAYTVLSNNPFYDITILSNVRELVRRRQQENQIPKDPQEIITEQVSSENRDSSRIFVANRNKVVFIVHGRNKEAVSATREFLESIKLIPKTLDDVFASMDTATPQTEETLKRAFSLAQAVIVLFTPDDIGCLRKCFRDKKEPTSETRPNGQPRLNVIYEAGWAMGGPFRTRTIFIEIGEVKLFSDISGLITVRMTDDVEGRRRLIERLNVAGCACDDRDGSWRETGKFDASVKEITFFERHGL